MPRPSLTQGPWTTERLPRPFQRRRSVSRVRGQRRARRDRGDSHRRRQGSRRRLRRRVPPWNRSVPSGMDKGPHLGDGSLPHRQVAARTLHRGIRQLLLRQRRRLAAAVLQGHQRPLFQKRPTTVRVIAGRTTRGIDAALQRGGQISGTVRSQSGKPLPGVCIFAYLGTHGLGNGSSSGRNGRYEIHSLFPGKYTVHFSADGVCGDAGSYADQWWPDSSTQKHARTIVIKYGLIVRHVDAPPSHLQNDRDDHRAPAVAVVDPLAERAPHELAELVGVVDPLVRGPVERLFEQRSHVVERGLVDP